MTTITKHLPWFIKDLGISIVGKVCVCQSLSISALTTFQECYLSLVENLTITDVKCLKYSLSKCLGIGIVIGGSIMKVPQLFLSESS